MKRMHATRLLAATVSAAALAALGACMSSAGGGMDAGMSAGMDSAMASASAGANVKMVGGAAMYPSRNIVENAVNSRDHTTLVTAVKAAGLVDTLAGSGPFTVFAPTNAAFDRLPAGTVPTLVKPENKAKLTQVLTYHVVPGRVTASELMSAISAGGGTATLTTVQGGRLTARQDGSAVIVTDAAGGSARVTIADVMQSNGIIHVVDTVLMPG